MKTEAKAVLFSLFLGVLAWFVSGLLRVLDGPSASEAQASLLRSVFLLNLPARLFVVALFLASGLMTGRVLRQRRLAQDELRASRARAQQLFDRAPDGMWEIGRDRVIAQANEALCELAGAPLDAIMGRTCGDVLHTSLCGTERCPVHQAEHGQPPAECETAVTCPDGRQALCVIHSRPIYAPDGNLAGLIQSFRNVTEQRKAEARFQALVETTGDGVTVVDPEGRITYANEAFCEMLGYTEEELLGRVGASLCDEENQALLKAQLERRLTGAEDRYELVYNARDGSAVTVLISATPLFDPQGAHAGSFAVMKNVTELKQAEEQVAHLNSVLLAVRNVNQLITRETDREKLLQGACDCLIETRGYSMAVLALVDEQGALTATYGAAPGWPDYQMDPAAGLKAWELLARQTGPPTPVVVGEQQCQWTERLAGEWRAGRTSMIVRLEWGGARYGFLGISLPARMADNEEEQSLFHEVADDIAFALHALDLGEQRRQALERLELTQFAVDRAADAVFWIDRQGRILYVNQACCDRLGYSLEELLQMRVSDLDPRVPEEIWNEHWERVRSDRGIMFESVHRAKDGHQVPVEITINNLKFKGEDYHFTFARDITERKRAEQELQRLNRQYELLVESQLVETFIVQRERLIFANRTMHERLGYEPGELIGKSVLELLPDERQEELATWHQRRARGDAEASDEFETQLLTKRGVPRWVQLWSQQISDFEGTPTVIGHMVDVTEARELRSQLEHSQRLEGLGTLAGGVAHEFNNVLQAILLNASLLQMERVLSPAETEKVKSIIERTEYGARLTDQLLTFSRRAPAQYRPLNLNNILEETQALLMRTVPRQIQITCAADPDLWAVNADAGRIKQVLINLALNARDAMPAGGRLTFETSNVMLSRADLAALPKLQPGPHVLVKVADTGVGMDPQTISRAFEPFFTTKGVGQGTGLGLSIVHGIIDTHGGAVRVHSAPGAGTIFQICLPADPEATVEASAPLPPTAYQGGSETVLIVDDELEVLNGAEQVLRNCGYHVLTATNGQAALDLCQSQEQSIDLVLLDLVMPGMSGQETLSRLRKLDPDLRIVIASGYISPSDRDRHGRHVAGHLEKPFTPDRMLAVVREVLDRA